MAPGGRAGLPAEWTSASGACSIRPERHLTSDGVTPLPPKQIGRRVTSKKARMWNDIYLGEVNFWRDFLSGGNPKVVLNFGDQSAVIDTEMLAFGVDWPGIPGDNKPFTNTTYDMDLFSRLRVRRRPGGRRPRMGGRR